MRSSLFMAALGVLALAVAGIGLSTHESASAATTTIDTGNFYFCADADQGQVCETDITAGDTVTWSIEEGTHEITQCSDNTFPSQCSGGFDSGSKTSGSTFSQTFNTAGTIYYHCQFHPTQMKGKLVVAAASTATPTPTAAPTAAATNSPAPTSAALPKTGGPPADGGLSGWIYAMIALGIGLLGGSMVTLVVARKRA